MYSDIIKSILVESDDYRGLTSVEASKRLQYFGSNSHPHAKQKGFFGRIVRIFGEPMMLLILITAVVYFFIGEHVESIVFFIAIIPIALMEYFQQSKTDKAVSELDKVLEEKCKVYRDNKLITEDVKNLVPGDLVHLVAGDKVPADGYIFSSSGLMVDESMLTGESVPVVKHQISKRVKDIDAEQKTFQGTLIAQGGGEFLVALTGRHTEYGKLGNLLEKITKEKTPLQKKIYRFIRTLAVIAIFVAIVVGILLTLLHGWRDGLLGGLTMAMSLLPEEFPIVFSVFLVLGVWRLAKKKALVREMATVETLGSATVICTDKTGTLTEGRMQLKKIYYKNNLIEIDLKSKKYNNDLMSIVKKSVLSLEQIATDPLEIEMQRFAKFGGLQLDKFFGQHRLIKSSSFDAKTKMVHHIWCDNTTDESIQHSVGAPEFIINSCSLTKIKKQKIISAYEQMSSEGLRVIALAEKKSSKDSDISMSKLEFIGLLAMSDPPRKEAKNAIKTCQEAGIRVIMITGDNKLTAKNIAEQIGMNFTSNVVDGEMLEEMSPAALKNIVSTHNIFARVRPEHKYLIVSALQKNGEVVAMTGDGVNDSPALKKANIGIAMGLKGTEVARAAADMILLDDNFLTISKAVKEGRKIYRNMQQAFTFLLSFHMPIIGLAIVPLFFGQSLIFLPIHIIFLELICDPASVLGFEKEKAPRNIMNITPRPVGESLIPGHLWSRIVIQGLTIFLISFGFYWFFTFKLDQPVVGRTLAFSALVISQILLIFLTREWYQVKNNLTLAVIGVLTILSLAAILFIPWLNSLFHLSKISFPILGLVFLISFFISALVSFIFKIFNIR